MESIKRYITERNIWFLTGAVLFVYMLLRALYIPYIHDEIASYFHYIQKEEFLPGSAHWDANNHVLNSFFSVVIYRLFGDNEFLMRFPNILSFILYFFVVLKLAKLIKSSLLRNLMITALLFSHGYMEFFALNRGYGMSMAFLICQIWLFIKWKEKQNTKLLLLFALSGSLAVWANLTLLPVVYIIDFLLVFTIFYYKLKVSVKQWIIIIILALILKLPAVMFGFELNSRGALYYGGNDFFNLTVQCLEFLMWGLYSWWTDALVIIIFAVILFLFIWKLVKKQIDFVPVSFSLFFFLAIAAIFAQHFILGINYPEDRTGMYLYPLFIISFFSLLDSITIKYLKHIAFIVILLPLHFIFTVNISGVTIWKNQGMPESFYNYIRNDYKCNRPLLAASQKLLGFSWTYHDHTHDPVLGPLQHNGYTDGLAEYLIAIPKHFNEIDFGIYDKVDEDAWSGNILLKRREPVRLKMLYDTLHPDNIHIKGEEFYVLYEAPADSFRGKTIAIEVNGSIASFDNILYAIITWTGSTSDNPIFYYEQYHLDWYRRSVHRFRVTYMLKDIPNNLETIKVYIYSSRSQEYIINKAELRLYLVENKKIIKR